MPGQFDRFGGAGLGLMGGGQHRLGRGPGDLCNETVSHLRHGIDVLVPLALVSERLAQERDGVGEVGLLDERFGPHLLQQFLFRHQAACTRDEDDEEVESLRRKGDGLSIAQERALLGLYGERAEVVHLSTLQ